MSTQTPVHIPDLTDEQVIAIAAALGWKATEAKRIRNLINLNRESSKVQLAIVAEINSPPEDEEILAAESAPAEDTGDHRPTQSKNEPNGKSFGMAEVAAARYLQEEYGLVPRMARRAINRGVYGYRGQVGQYTGKGYRVTVADLSETEFDIRITAA